jgi:nucleotide-binding universal stress UspA family protein
MQNGSTFQRILLATDGSSQASAATDTAITVAHASAAAVRVVHVWNLEVREDGGRWDVEMRSEAQDLVDAAVKRIGDRGVVVSGEILHADDKHIADVIANEAKDIEADLVVLGSRGLSEWQAMRKHSVSHQLLTKLDCPVLVVTSLPLTKERGIKALLAIAGGPDVATGVRAAAAAAAPPGSKVLVTHVQTAVFGSQGMAYVEPDDEARATIETAIALLKEKGIAAEGMLADAGPVAPTVAALAKTWGADLIVSGSGRFSETSAWVLGSVSHDLMHISDRPVLVAERIKS